VSIRERVRTGNPQVLPELKRAALDPATRRQAFREASRLPEDLGREYFLWAVQQPNEPFRRNAFEAWAEAYPNDPETRTAVRKRVDARLSSGKADGRIEALDLLRRLPGPESRKRLLATAEDPSPRVRRAVARCAGSWKDTALVETILVLSTDEDREVGEAGLEAFAALADELPRLQWVTGLTRVLSDTPHPELKAEAIRELGRAARKKALPPEALKALEAAARNTENPETAEFAQHALRDIWKTAKAKPRKPEPPSAKKIREKIKEKVGAPVRTGPDDGK
jgi:hypothetical protein